jgi:amino acid adenylation domain-containing protein
MLKEVIEGFQLSPQQRHLWRLSAGDAGGAYGALCVVRIEGRLDEAALRAALREVVARHEILRTTFHRLPGMDLPLQVVGEAGAPELIEADLSGRDAAGREAGLAALDGMARYSPEEFERGRLLRAALVTLSPTCRLLRLSLPSLCADAAGLGGLARELGSAYAAATGAGVWEGEPAQYADLAEWQNEMLESEEARAGREFWAQQTLSAPPDLGLPFERQAAPDGAFDPRRFVVGLEAGTAERVASLSAALGVSARGLLLACWEALLWRLTGQADRLLWVAFDGRKYAELEDALGPFAKFLPVRCRAEKGTTFAEFLRQTEETLAEAATWQECYSPERAGRHDEAAAGPTAAPFGFEFNEPPAPFDAGGVRFSVEEAYACAERCRVKLSCARVGETLRAEFHYDAGLYNEDDVRRLAAQYRTLLDSALRDPGLALGALQVLDGEERRRLLVEFNDAPAPYRLDKCLHELFEEQAERTPDAAAVVSEQGSLTYSELDAASDRLALRLRRLGVGPDVRVGLLLERSAGMVVAILGVLKAGGAYLPLDPSYPAERLAFMLGDSGAGLLLTERRLAGRIPAHGARLLYLDDEAETPAGESAEELRGAATTSNLAYVIYTSGSTGRPKGVMISHRAITNRLLWMLHAFPLTADDVVLQKTPFSFDASVWEFFAPLLAGARLLMARPDGHQDAAYLVRTVVEGKVTVLQLVPSMFRLLLETSGVEACNASLRHVFCGGEALPAALHERSASLLKAELHNLYGPTETAIDAASWSCRSGIRTGTVPIGRPITNARLYVLDENMSPVPVGVPGELYVGGAGLARGYLNRPGLTAERFIPDPFSAEPGARLYRTGDSARHLPEGALEFLGRLDEQVKVRGFRIETGEIEAALRRHPGVRESIVVAREDAPGDVRLVAYTVSGEGAAPSASELREFLRERLPDYMVPSAFVALDSLPLTPNGKVNRGALPPPAGEGVRPEKALAPPRDNLEGQLVRIWREVLGVDGPLGITDNFFDLGGHSLLAVRLMAQIHKWFGQELPLSALFEGATVEQLAAVLRGQAEARRPSPVVAIQPRGERPPFFCVHTGSGEVLCYEPWSRRLRPDQPFYGVQDHFSYTDGDPAIPIEEMAARYVEALRAARPEGPYLLGGWSFGGLVAFEMARQLRAQGQSVPLLAVVDAAAPALLKKTVEADDAVLLTILANEFTRYSMKDEEVRRMEATLRGLGPEEQLAHVMRYFARGEEAEANVEPRYASQFLRRHLRVFRARVLVSLAYVPQIYPGRVTLFRSQDAPPEFAGLDPARGWGELSTEPVEIHVVPGNHATMGLEPHVGVLAERLQSCIDRALAAGGAGW